MDIHERLTKIIVASPDEYLVIGIIGQPYPGKRTLAKGLIERFETVGRSAECFSLDDLY